MTSINSRIKEGTFFSVFILTGSNNNPNNEGEGTARKQTFYRNFDLKDILNSVKIPF